MGYGKEQVQELTKKGQKWNPLKMFTPAVNRLVTNVRRPHGYGTDKEDFAGGGGLLGAVKAFATDTPTYSTEDNWSNRWGKGLFEKSFGGELGDDSGWMEDDEGNVVINPEAKGSRTMQARLNDAFLRASTEGMSGWNKDAENYVGGKKYKHPDLGGGEDYYKAKVDVLGDVYYDEEGNFVDYYNYDLDEGEKLKGKANWMRKLISPFSTPPTVTGRAEKIPFSTKKGEEDVGWGDVGIFSGKGSDVSDEIQLDAKDEVTSGITGDYAEAVKDKPSFLKGIFSGKGFEGSGGGTGVKTSPFDISKYTGDDKGLSSPIERDAPIKETPEQKESDGGGLSKIFGAMKGMFKPGEGFQGEGGGTGVKTPAFNLEKYGGQEEKRYGGPQERPAISEEEGIQEEGGGINRKSIMKALGLDDEEEEDYEATMMDKFKGLGYRGSAKQNMALMEKMGGRGPSIVDYLKSEGQGSSMDARRKLWEQYG